MTTCKRCGREIEPFATPGTWKHVETQWSACVPGTPKFGYAEPAENRSTTT